MRRSAAFRYLTWLIAAALMAQSWLAHVAMANVSARPDTIVICTGSGFKVISLTDDLWIPHDPADEKKEQGEQRFDCTACLVQASTQAIGDDTLGVEPFLWLDHFFDTILDLSPTPSRWLGAHPTRAPPTV